MYFIYMIVLLVCFTVLLVGDILMLHLICSTSTIIMIPHSYRVSNRDGKNMYISKKFESRHGPYNI